MKCNEKLTNKIKINKKLSIISSEISNKSIVSDIGCDHNYLNIYLLSRKIASKCYSIDNKIMPLRSAKKNSLWFLNKEEYNHLEFILNDGINNLSYTNNVVVVSGMGAQTIINIIKKNISWCFNQKLLLLPSDIDNCYKIRKFARDNKFLITKEICIYEKNKYYNLLVLEHNDDIDKVHISPEEIIIGKNQINYHIWKAYLNDFINNKNNLSKYNQNIKNIINIIESNISNNE